MAFNRMRRQQVDHGYIAQCVDIDFGWIGNGSLPVTQWQKFAYMGVASVGAGLNAGVGGSIVASIQRVASGQFNVYLALDAYGEKFVDGGADVMCGTAGFVASYTAEVGSWTPPAVSGTYTGAQAGYPYITIYTTARGTTTLTDVPSAAIASIRVWLRFSDSDYG